MTNFGIVMSISGGDWTLLIFGIVLLVIGIIGCIIPALPGPPISYLALLLLHFTNEWSVSSSSLIWLGVITILVTILDYIVPIYGTKKLGGTKYGVWGSTIGLLVGLFFAPLGIILGPFFGAVIGELLAGKDSESALKSGFGSFLGFLTGTILKVAVSLIILFVFFRVVF
jgi:uncharacterized protein YqgC (DUF456 family)